jgi:hypothetical protein
MILTRFHSGKLGVGKAFAVATYVILLLLGIADSPVIFLFLLLPFLLFYFLILVKFA